MPRKPKFRPKITRIKLNSEQAVLTCNCWSSGIHGTDPAPQAFTALDFIHVNYCGTRPSQSFNFVFRAVVYDSGQFGQATLRFASGTTYS